MAPDGGLPEQLDPRAPITEQSLGSGGDLICIRPIELPNGFPFDPRFGWAEIVLFSSAADGQSAVEIAADRLLPFLDSLSFQVQAPVVLSHVEALDVTEPIEAGEERELLSYATPWGFPIRRFRPASEALGDVAIAQPATLDERLADLEDRPRAAFDWYLKGVGAALDVDRFIFFWISFEILSDLSEVKATAPLKLRCNHDLENCPECGKETERIIQGATRKAYLQHLEVSEQDAQELWAARQILHGARKFDSKVMDDLSRLSRILRAIIHREIKRIAGFDPAEPPLVTTEGMLLAPELALTGLRQVTESDLEG